MAKKSTQKSYLERIETEVSENQSKFNLILGALIVVVVGVLLFNYFNRNKAETTPEAPKTEEQQADVSPENLPGRYTVKEGDTLFLIAEKYYGDGFKYNELATANNLTNVDALEVGQTLDIPKLETTQAGEITTPTSQPTEVATKTDTTVTAPPAGGTLEDQWGPAITGDKYTVIEGDWLSKISGRAYGNIMDYSKIAEANNIQNPDLIFPGMVLTIPR